MLIYQLNIAEKAKYMYNQYILIITDEKNVIQCLILHNFIHETQRAGGGTKADKGGRGRLTS